MIDDKSGLSQFNKLQILMHKIIDDGTNLDESFQVITIIAKLSSSWKYCRKELK